jgi:hypothetical protein
VLDVFLDGQKTVQRCRSDVPRIDTIILSDINVIQTPSFDNSRYVGHHYLGPVWIRGIYAKIVFSPKYILERKDDVFWCLILREVTRILRGQTIENTANPDLVNQPHFL